MHKKSKIFRGKSVVWECRYHLVFVTKYRRKTITPEVFEKILDKFNVVCESFDGAVEECNYESDHVHILLSLPPKHSISKLVNSMKGVSSRAAKAGAFWSSAYYVGSCGKTSIETLKKYIENQRNSSLP